MKAGCPIGASGESDKRGTTVDPVISEKNATVRARSSLHRVVSLNNLTMPRSKRARVVHESKTTKKSHKEQTRRLYANIRECVEEYDHLFVFAVDNMRNTYLKDVRTEFSDSRYVFSVQTVHTSFWGKEIIMAISNCILTLYQCLLRQNQSHGRGPRQQPRK